MKLHICILTYDKSALFLMLDAIFVVRSNKMKEREKKKTSKVNEKKFGDFVEQFSGLEVLFLRFGWWQIPPSSLIPFFSHFRLCSNRALVHISLPFFVAFSLLRCSFES